MLFAADDGGQMIRVNKRWNFPNMSELQLRTVIKIKLLTWHLQRRTAKARGAEHTGVCDRRATQSGWMQRRRGGNLIMVTVLNKPFWLALAILLAVQTHLISFPLNATSPSLSINFNSSSDCATRKQFDIALEKLLTHWKGDSGAQFEVSITEADVTIVTLRVISDEQVFIRQVKVRDCTLAARVAALLIAITLDPATMAQVTDTTVVAALTQGSGTTANRDNDADASGGNTTRQPAQSEKPTTNDEPAKPSVPADEPNETAATTTEAPAKPAADTDKPETPAESPQSTETRTVRQGITVGAGMSHLALPEWNLGPLLTYTARINRLFIFSSGQFSFSQKTAIDSASDASLRLWLISFHAGAGTMLQSKSWFVAPLAGVGLHLFLSKTTGLTSDTSHLQPVFALFAGVFSALMITRQAGISLTLHIDWLLSDSHYNVGTLGTVHDTGHAILQWGIGFFHFF